MLPACNVRVFHNHTKLAMLTLLPTLFSHFFCSFLLYLLQLFLVNIRNQGVHRYYISGLNALLEQLIFGGRAKMKLAMLAFLYCAEFVKNSIIAVLLAAFSLYGFEKIVTKVIARTTFAWHTILAGVLWCAYCRQLVSSCTVYGIQARSLIFLFC